MPEEQLRLELQETAPRRAGLPRLTEAEKRAQRTKQDGKCHTCGGVSKGGMALDVVRGPGGVLLAFCRSHRLSYDAVERCRKGAARRRRLHPPRPQPPGQRRLKGL